jgi:hypothetical protein
MRFLLFVMAVLVSGCAVTPTEKTGYLSDADYASVTAGQKGGLRMTLVEPPQELYLYDKESYAYIAESDRRGRSGFWSRTIGQTDESVPFDPTLRKGMQLCPDAETMKRTAYFVFYPAGKF